MLLIIKSGKPRTYHPSSSWFDSFTSSNVESFRYWRDDEVLDVRFLNGSEYRYYGVAENFYRNFKRAGSKGKYVHRRLRDKFKFEKLKSGSTPVRKSMDASGHMHGSDGKFVSGASKEDDGLQDVISGKRKPTAEEYGNLLDQGYDWNGEGFSKPEVVDKPKASEEVLPSVHSAAADKLTPKAKVLIESAHDWEKTAPWNTQSSGPFPDGFARTKKEHGEEAHFSDGTIYLSGKFFQPPMSNHEEARRHVIYHELGHQLADTMVSDGTSFQLHDAGVIPAEHGLGSGTGGGHGDEEALADAYALLHSDPMWLEERYPKLMKVVIDRALALGMPVPPEVK